MSKRDLALLRKATPQEWVKAHSDAMAVIEMIWQLAAEALDKTAGDDRLCPAALAAGEAREMMYLAKAYHAKADVLAARCGGLVPGGEPVIMPFFGGR